MSKELTDSVNWKIAIKTSANKNDLTDKQIDNIFHCHECKKYQDFTNSFNKKMRDEYDIYPVAKWQNSKKEELEKKFFDNLKYNISDDKVDVTIEFEVMFTDEFDKDDVLNWIEGLSRIAKVHLFAQTEKIIDREEFFENEYPFIENLVFNQEISMTN